MKADELHAKFQVGTMFNHVRFLARNGEVDAEDRTMVVPPAVPSLLPRGVSLQVCCFLSLYASAIAHLLPIVPNL